MAIVLLDDAKVALSSALLVCVFPLDIIFASTVFPAMGIAALSALCTVLYVLALRKSSVSLAFLCGAILGLAYTHRATALYLFLPALIHLFHLRRITRFHVAMGLGLLCVIFLESLAFYLLLDDPLVRWKILAAVRDWSEQLLHMVTQLSARSSYAATQANWFETRDHLRWGGAFGAPIISLFSNQEYGLFYYFVPLALIAVLVKRDWAILPVVVVFVCLSLYILYGTRSPTAYLTLRAWPRYMSVATIPACIILAWWLRNCMGAMVRRCLLALLISSSLVSVYLDNTRTFVSIADGIISYANDHALQIVVVEKFRFLDVFVRNRGDTEQFSVLLHANPKRPSHANPFKLDPHAKSRTIEDLENVRVVLNPNSKFNLPGHCVETGVILRTQRWFSGLATEIGGWAHWLTRKINPKDPHRTYDCSR